MNKINKFISVVLSVSIILLSFFIIEVYAETVISGNLSKEDNKDSVMWTLNENGDMIISGSGEMKGFPTYFSFDGTYSKIKNVIIEDGIVNIGSYVFGMCENMSSISIPLSLKAIDENAFVDATSLNNVYYSGTREQWNEIRISSEGNDYLLNAKINYMEEAHTCSFGEWRVTNEPTCVGAGNKTRECSCGKKEIESIPATGIHDFSAWETTVNETEEHDGEETRECKVCNFTETRIVDNIQSSEKHKIGDADGDGKVMATDARIVLQVVAGLKQNDDLIFSNVDINDDNIITAIDARMILQIVAGIK